MFRDPLASLQEEGLVETDGSAVTLTRPGLLRADRLLPLFYDTRYSGTRYT